LANATQQKVKTMRTLLVLLMAFFTAASFAAPKGALENPQPNDYASGIYLFSGWVCEAENVQILLDGVQYLDVAYGSDRLDTLSTCGDTNNGFGILVNMANLAAGEHQATLYADGQEVAQSAFKTADRSTGEFVQGLEGCAISEGFPNNSRETILKWTTSIQGFQVSEERVHPLADNIDGLWNNAYWEASIWIYRADCGPASLFMHANVTDGLGGKDVLKMTGQLGEEKTLLQSTAGDGANREATLIIKSDNLLQIDFSACGPIDIPSCEFTPEGGRAILKKVPNIMSAATPATP
jgi:hypothetical protein